MSPHSRRPRGGTPGADWAGSWIVSEHRPTRHTAFRRLPPYLRRHADRLRGDPSATVWIAVGCEAWRWARARERTHIATLLPPDQDPGSFDWRLCAEHDPILLHRAGIADGDQVHGLIVALIRDGTDRALDDQTGALYVAREVARVA